MRLVSLRMRSMKILGRLGWIVACAGLAGVGALHAAGTREQVALDKKAILAPVNKLFEGMARRDAATIKDAALPGGTMVLMRDGKPTQMTFDAFAEHIGQPGTTKIEERIHDPLVRVDHDLAMVWAPFEFLVDGKVDHCGTDLFNLVREDGRWLIASVADTGRKDCPIR